MVNPLCTLGHANPTCPSNPIVHCRTDRISMVNHLCTLGHANPICPTVDHEIGWTGRICSLSTHVQICHHNPFSYLQCHCPLYDN